MFTFATGGLDRVLLPIIMILKFENIQNKVLRRWLEHCVYVILLLILIPSFFYFEILIVLPTVTEQWSFEYLVHLTCAIFLLSNIIGNMIFGMWTNTSIRGRVLAFDDNKNNWTLCTSCECMRPPRAWHCDSCNTCILKRDHHCSFFACCIGYYNQRYFIYFVFYVFISMVYAFWFNVKFIYNSLSWNHGFVLLKFIFPLVSIAYDFGEETLHVLLIVINVIVGLFTGFLFIYHINNILYGKTTAESKHRKKDFSYDYGWKLNLKEVLGIKWYLTWISPFINSPLVGNGIEWHKDHKHN